MLTSYINKPPKEHNTAQRIPFHSHINPFLLPLINHPQMHQPEATDPLLLPFAGGATAAFAFPPHHRQEVSPNFPWSHHPPPFHPVHFHANPTRDHDPIPFPPFRSSSSLQFEALGHHSGVPFGLQVQAELSRMTAQDLMDAKALAASKSHSEAERRRRERINSHLAKLRSLLPSTTKTDKASLLAEVIHHMKELKRQTSAIAETSSLPTEADELAVDTSSELDCDGGVVVKVLLCCDNRSDLLPDLIKALKGLRLRTLKSEITTVGGRVKNVLFVTGDDGGDGSDDNGVQRTVRSIEEALRVVIENNSVGKDDSTSGNPKLQRTNNLNILA